MGRLVQNHSTHIDGLIKWLKRIVYIPGIQTITPAVLSKTNGREENLTLKVTIKTDDGYKLLARKGKLVQEVFLVTKLGKKEIVDILKETNPFSSRRKQGH